MGNPGKKEIPTGAPVTPATETGPFYSSVKIVSAELEKSLQMAVRLSDGLKQLSSKNLQESENLAINSRKLCNPMNSTFTPKVPKKDRKPWKVRRKLMPEFDSLAEDKSATSDGSLSWIVPDQQPMRTTISWCPNSTSDSLVDLSLLGSEKDSVMTLQSSIQPSTPGRDVRKENASESLTSISLSTTPDKCKTDRKYLKARSRGYTFPVIKNKEKRKRWVQHGTCEEQNGSSRSPKWIESPRKQVVNENVTKEVSAAGMESPKTSSPIIDSEENQIRYLNSIHLNELYGYIDSLDCLESPREQVVNKNVTKAVSEAGRESPKTSSPIIDSEENQIRYLNSIHLNELYGYIDSLDCLESSRKQVVNKNVTEAVSAARRKSPKTSSPIIDSKENQIRYLNSTHLDEGHGYFDSLDCLESPEEIDTENGKRGKNTVGSKSPKYPLPVTSSRENERCSSKGNLSEEDNEFLDSLKWLNSPIRPIDTKDIRSDSNKIRSKYQEHSLPTFTSRKNQRRNPNEWDDIVEKTDGRVDSIRRLVTLIQRIESDDAEKEKDKSSQKEQTVSSDLPHYRGYGKGSKSSSIKKPFNMQKYIYTMIEVMSRKRSPRRKKEMRREFDFNEYIQRLYEIKEKL